MSDDRHIIWSNYALDYEDWRDDLEAEYPDLTEEQRIALMYEINGDYLDDERTNLNIQLSGPILVIGILASGTDVAVGTRRSGAATSGTVSMPTQTTAPGMWTSWAICDATPFTMMAPITTFTVRIRMA